MKGKTFNCVHTGTNFKDGMTQLCIAALLTQYGGRHIQTRRVLLSTGKFLEVASEKYKASF